MTMAIGNHSQTALGTIGGMIVTSLLGWQINENKSEALNHCLDTIQAIAANISHTMGP